METFDMRGKANRDCGRMLDRLGVVRTVGRKVIEKREEYVWFWGVF